VQAQNLERLDEERLQLHSSVTTVLACFTERLAVAQAVAPPSKILGQVVDEYSTIDRLVTRVLGVDPRPRYNANLLHPSVCTIPSHQAEVVMSPAGNMVCLLSLCRIQWLTIASFTRLRLLLLSPRTKPTPGLSNVAS